MERESFGDFARRVGIAIEDLEKMIHDAEAEEEPPEEINNPYYVEPHHTSDFLCSRLDLIPWYTSGFQ